MSTPTLSTATTPSTACSTGLFAGRADALPATARAEDFRAEPAGATRSAARALQRGCLALPSPLPLFHGGSLERAHLAYELVGPPGAPVVVALGGISAGCHVAGVDEPTAASEGWWSGLVGRGKAVDTRRYRVLSFDWLGGNDGSTGPRQIQERLSRGTAAADFRSFPEVDTRDQARALAALLHHLAIPRICAIVGASYGGMVALAFAEELPFLVERVVVISAADRPHARSTAWRAVQRRIVGLSSSWGSGLDGLALSRALAMVTYRSPRELEHRFGGPPRLEDGAFRFPVEDYLDARGAEFAARFHPGAFVTLSRSIDLHRVDPTRIRVPTTLVAVTSDQLVPVEDSRRLAGELAGPCRLEELPSLYGHDAFLKEYGRLTPIVRRALGSDLGPEHAVDAATADVAAAEAAGEPAESTARHREGR